MTTGQQRSCSHPTMQAASKSAPADISATPETPTRLLRVFLCHAEEDKPAVRPLYQRLLADGVDPWFDEESLEGGEHWQEEIARAVRSTDAVIICLSTSATSQASHFNKQVKRALDMADEQPEGSIFIIPLKLDACSLPDRLSHIYPVSLVDEGGYDRLLRALRKRAHALGRVVEPVPVQPDGGGVGHPSSSAQGIYKTSRSQPMSLTGTHRQQFQQALLSAFPSESALRQMVMHQFTLNLATIAGGSNLADIAFNLIDWFEAQGRTTELLDKAREANSGNPALREFAAQFTANISPAPAPVAGGNRQPATEHSPASKPLSNQEMNNLVDLLLLCLVIQDKSTRNDVLSFLPDNVRNAIPRRDQARADVVNIVRTCQNYTGGLDELIEAVRSLEGNSVPMQAVDAFMQNR